MVKQGFLNLPLGDQDRIIEAALDEFAQKDYDGTSMNQIIQNAGISKGSMYHYFQNKEDLYMHVLERLMFEKTRFLTTAMQELASPIEDMGFFESLALQLRVAVQFARDNYRYHMIGVHLQNMQEGALKERIWGKFRVSFEQYIAQMVDEAFATGMLRPSLEREFVIRILGFVLLKFTDIYPNYEDLMRRGDDAITTEMDQVVDFLKHGLSGRDK